MRVLLLFYVEDKIWDLMTKEQAEKVQIDCDTYDEGLKESDCLVFGQRLQSVDKASTVRTRKGKVLCTDGPFVETKEAIVGLIVIEVPSLDEAQRSASPPTARCLI